MSCTTSLKTPPVLLARTGKYLNIMKNNSLLGLVVQPYREDFITHEVTLYII